MYSLYHFFNLSSVIWLVILIIIEFISYKANFLSRSGSNAAIMVGSVIIVTSKSWLYPLFLFFILSSIITRISAHSNKTAKSEHFPRAAAQVFANGSVAAISAASYIIFPHPAVIILFLGSLAAATSDTWSTEIGAFSGTQPRLLTNFKKVRKGTSGGITLIGIVGGIMGSSALAASGLLIFKDESVSQYLELGIFAVIIGGITGNIFDSLLGVSLQSKYQCVKCHLITDDKIHCETTADYYSGLWILNNDSVNFLCTLTGGISAAIFWLLFSH